MPLAAADDTVHKLSIVNVQKLKTEFFIQIEGHLKQSRLEFTHLTLSFKAFPPDRQPCIYFVLKEYLAHTRQLRNAENSKLLISYVKPHQAVSRDTVSRWIRTV